MKVLQNAVSLLRSREYAVLGLVAGVELWRGMEPLGNRAQDNASGIQFVHWSGDAWE